MKKAVLFFVLTFLFSCTSNTIYEKPKDLIPKDTMVLLLADLYIASSAYFEKNTNLERKVNYMPLIYNKYQIDSVRFLSSNHYYMTIIDEYDELNKLVNKNLSLQKESLENNMKPSKSPNNQGID